MNKFRKILNKFTKEQIKHFETKVLPNSRYNRYFNSTMFYPTLFSTFKEFKEFCSWYREDKKLSYTKEDDIKKLKNSENQNNFSELEDSFDTADDYGNAEEELFHSKFYYYNKAKDEYIVHLPSKKRPFIITGDYWRSIIDAYSNWDNQPSTINEMCRKFGLSRNTLVDLL